MDKIFLIEEKEGGKFIPKGWTSDKAKADRLTNQNRNLSIRYRKLIKYEREQINPGGTHVRGISYDKGGMVCKDETLSFHHESKI